MAVAIAVAYGKKKYLYEVNPNCRYEELEFCLDTVCNIYRGIPVFQR